MQESNYTGKQKEALQNVRGYVDQLINLEDLQTESRQRVLDLDDAIDQVVADLSLDRLPAYDVLEERLKIAITEARAIGLGEDPFIKRIGSLAFS